jgi:hypothetical protein
MKLIQPITAKSYCSSLSAVGVFPYYGFWLLLSAIATFFFFFFFYFSNNLGRKEICNIRETYHLLLNSTH